MRSRCIAFAVLTLLLAGPSLAAPPGTGFVHVATAQNTQGDITQLDHLLLNDQPGAVPLVTHNWNPGGPALGVDNHSDVRVFYDALEGRWTLANEDGTDIAVGAAFNVFVPSEEADAFVHTTTEESITGNWSTIEHPATDDAPDAIVFASHAGITDHPHPLGVWYTGDARWAVFNEDEEVDMPADLSFHVFVGPDDPDVFVHTAEEDTITGHTTTIDHPRVNDDPNAILLVTQSWNPGGGAGIYNESSVAVYYVPGPGRWRIFNQLGAPMPVGTSFHVAVVPEPEAALGQGAALALLGLVWRRWRARVRS